MTPGNVGVTFFFSLFCNLDTVLLIIYLLLSSESQQLVNSCLCDCIHIIQGAPMAERIKAPTLRVTRVERIGLSVVPLGVERLGSFRHPSPAVGSSL